MGDQRPEASSRETLTNEEIVTERRLRRRAFLSATGVFVAGGAASVVAGARTLAQQVIQNDQPKQDPDKPRHTDQPKPSDQPPPTDQPRPSDQPPPADPDQPREGDPDKKKKR